MLSNMDSRNRSIIKYYLISIILNLILSVLKLIIGITAHSRAIVLDAINGFSDMMSAGIAILSAVGVSASSLSDPRAAEIWDTILYRLPQHEGILRAQLFTVDFEEKVISFYVVLDYAQKNRDDVLRLLQEDLEQIFPDYTFEIHQSIDI